LGLNAKAGIFEEFLAVKILAYQEIGEF